MRRSGFSLLELSMVLLVSGLMLGFFTQMGTSVKRAECYTTTRAQLPTINEAIQRFVRKNDRLPMPAARNISIEDINYGREALAAVITQAGGVSFGALPFQALGLTPSMAGDCWGNKFTYMVTTALTTSAASGGYLDATVPGNIARKSTIATTTDSTIAYAIVSHGIDQLGAVELNYSGVSKGWCSAGLATLKDANCQATTAHIADAVLNDGKDAAANYFDDLVIAGGKPKILSSGCATRTETWDGVASGCTAVVPALAGGGSIVITDSTGSPTGSATASCSVIGVLTLSGTSCTSAPIDGVCSYGCYVDFNCNPTSSCGVSGCSAGTISNYVTDGSGNGTWRCRGIDGGANVNCSMTGSPAEFCVPPDDAV